MYSVIETITPEKATAYLKKNLAGNRSIGKKRVNDLCFAIRSGDWKLSPNGISFDTSGNLIDGQHRLTAIQKAGIPVECYVTYDAPSDAFNVIDRGWNRNLSDICKISGETLPDTVIASAVFLLKQITKQSVGRMDGVVIRFIRENAEMLHRAHQASVKGENHAIGRYAPFVAACWCAYVNGVDIAEIDRFCEVMNSGFAYNDEESAAIVMRNTLLDLKSKRSYYKADTIFKIAQNAIKCFVNKTPRRNAWKNPEAIYFTGTKAEEIVENIING